MTPYMTFLLQPFINDLDAFRKTSDTASDRALWAEIISTLTKTFIHDDGGECQFASRIANH